MGSSVTRIDLPAPAERREKFEALRRELGSHDQAKERTTFSAYPHGFAVGSLIEIVGPAKTTTLALFLKEHPDLRVAWVESRLTVNPYALFQRGVNLRNILFVEAGEHAHWCLTQILESGCLRVVVADNSWASMDERELRRYQLLSESHHTHFFLLSKAPHSSWIPHLQIEARSQTDLHVLRRRGVG